MCVSKEGGRKREWGERERGGGGRELTAGEMATARDNFWKSSTRRRAAHGRAAPALEPSVAHQRSASLSLYASLSLHLPISTPPDPYSHTLNQA